MNWKWRPRTPHPYLHPYLHHQHLDHKGSPVLLKGHAMMLERPDSGPNDHMSSAYTLSKIPTKLEVECAKWAVCTGHWQQGHKESNTQTPWILLIYVLDLALFLFLLSLQSTADLISNEHRHSGRCHISNVCISTTMPHHRPSNGGLPTCHLNASNPAHHGTFWFWFFLDPIGIT